MRWALGLFGLALATAYWPWMGDAAATPRWLVLGVGAFAGFWLVAIRPQRLTLAHAVAGLFMTWALVSCLWSPALEARDQAWKLAFLSGVFLLGSHLDNLRPFYIGAAIGVMVSGVLAGLDTFGLISYAQHVRPSGLFGNGLYMAEFAALIIGGLGGHGLWILAALCVPVFALAPTLPRGPGLGLMFVLIATSRLRHKLSIGALAVVILLPPAVMMRPSSVIERLDGWADLVRGLTPLGHGLSAYYVDAPKLEAHREWVGAERRLHANNDLLEIAYDLGSIGAGLAVLLILMLLFGSGPLPEKLVVLVFTVEGCFGFPFHLPWSAGVFALGAGHLARFCGNGLRAEDRGGIDILPCDDVGRSVGSAAPSGVCSADLPMVFYDSDCPSSQAIFPGAYQPHGGSTGGVCAGSVGPDRTDCT